MQETAMACNQDTGDDLRFYLNSANEVHYDKKAGWRKTTKYLKLKM
jgi:hypothetical protein